MKKLKFILATLVISSLLFTSCDTNDDSLNLDENQDSSINYNFGSTVSRDFIGQIVDENNDPIQNATVFIGNNSSQTDSNGIFIIKNASVKSNFAYITATKAGYLQGSRSVIPTSGENNVKIMMLSATVVGTVNSGTSGNVTLPNGTKVDFDGNFKKEDGSSYSGSVSVIMHHLDPEDANVEAKMPGMLLASDTNGEAKVLETFGMINVELLGSSGEKLQLASAATIEMPIAIGQMGSSPNTIPLWHFDDVKGYWVEEGSATKVGNKYVGSVSHFSWWNCDAQFPTVYLCLTVVDSNNTPLSNVQVELAPNNQTYPRTGTSDSNGEICGLIPSNQTITMNVLDNCGNVISTSQIGPFSSNTVLPNVIATSGMVSSTTVTGTLAQCNNSNVTDGYVLLNYGNQRFVSNVTNGSFSFNTLVCNANTTFTLEGYDYASLQTSGVINYTFVTPVTNIGNLLTCNAVTEYITYQIDNEPVDYFIGNISASSSPNGLNVSLQGATGTSSFYFYGSIFATGSYTTANFLIENSEVIIQNGVTNNVICNVSQIGAIGGYIDITFSGTYEDNSNVTHTITGVIHVIRDN
ncbi:hypothetical protein SY27_03485 [Flavobacterium sp. 316]|uniref:carboxypeptidase regulatory-like domain-containing protein n=1 Tax=Flavobacterium sp. 316 TaxID=1603293 RepID=UPI0005E07A4F|nr:carboxypeptidase regulatory-like domain-containing protein [Flavobacterium sp. 316]KIX22885.1 hypothetical protein SY27_03485 [Flavobacterium sp. 316]